MQNVILKTLPFLLLLAGCFEQGLMNNKPSLTSGSTSSNSSSDGPVDPDSLVAAIRVERAINVESARNPEYVKTSFADKVFNGVDIQGYGAGENGETFCLSNELYPISNKFDDPRQCRRPLNTTSFENEEEAELLSRLQSEDYNLESAKGLPLIIQTLQLFFSHKEAPFPNTYSVVPIEELKIQIKTAPIEWDAERQMLRWNTAQIATFNYSRIGCTPSASNAVNIDIQYDPSLDICSKANFDAKKCVPRNYHFLTGLWVYERGLSQPFEEQTVAPIGGYSGGGSAPSSLFSTRTKVFASFILPIKKGTDDLDYRFFPSTGSNLATSTTPKPFELSFGMYRAPGSLARSTLSTISENEILAKTNVIDGVVSTPIMGRFRNDGTDGVIADPNLDWTRRAIVGICIQGNRRYFSGTETVNNVVVPIEQSVHPVVHALKYQLRKIKVYLKPDSQ